MLTTLYQSRYIVQRLTATFALIVPSGMKALNMARRCNYRYGEFKLNRSHSKIDVRTISGGFSFLSVCLLVKMKNDVKFSSHDVHNLSHASI